MENLDEQDEATNMSSVTPIDNQSMEKDRCQIMNLPNVILGRKNCGILRDDCGSARCPTIDSGIGERCGKTYKRKSDMLGHLYKTHGFQVDLINPDNFQLRTNRKKLDAEVLKENKERKRKATL